MAVVEEIRPDDHAALDHALAFAARVGTSRAATARQHLERMQAVAAWTAMVARDAAGATEAVATANVIAALGLDTIQVNAFLRPGALQAFDDVLERIHAWGKQRAATGALAHVTSPTSHELEAWVHAGYEQVGERTRLQRVVSGNDLDLPAATVDGVAILPVDAHPQHEGAVLDLWRECHDDIPSALRFVGGDSPGFRAELGLSSTDPLPPGFLVAVEGDQPIGLALALRSTSDPAEANHRFTAVRRAARGRGVARALKVELIRWAAREGVTRLVASNDDGNVAMRQLNEALGYEPFQRILLLHRRLDGPNR